MLTFKEYITLAVVTGVISSFTALAGTWLGAHLTSRRVRLERASERQLKWHEDTAELLYEILVSVQEIVEQTRRRHPPSGDSAVVKRYAAAVKRYPLAAREASLYATASSIKKLHDLARELRVLAEDHSKPVMTLEDSIARFSPLIPAVERAAMGLAQEVRTQLKLEKLDPLTLLSLDEQL